MGEIKTCFKTAGENGEQIKHDIFIPLETPIEELVYIIILKNNLPVNKENGEL